MTWVRVVVGDHICKRPTARDAWQVGAKRGSVWECWDCGKHWRIKAVGPSGITWTEN